MYECVIALVNYISNKEMKGKDLKYNSSSHILYRVGIFKTLICGIKACRYLTMISVIVCATSLNYHVVDNVTHCIFVHISVVLSMSYLFLGAFPLVLSNGFITPHL